MSNHDNDLSAKEERIADLYASGFAPAQIAADVSNSVTSIYRILRRPAVKARIAEARAAALRPIVQLVQDELVRNVQKLVAIRDAHEEQTRNKIAAVQELNDLFLKLDERVNINPQLADLNARLAELEDSQE